MKNPLWSNRAFVALSGAQLLSSFGNWIVYLAVMILIAIRWHPLCGILGPCGLDGARYFDSTLCRGISRSMGP